MRRCSGVLLLVTGLTSFPASVSAGMCALCRQALASGGNPGIIQVFYWSILLIAGIPLVIMGTVGLLAWRSARLKRRSDKPGHSPFHATT